MVMSDKYMHKVAEQIKDRNRSVDPMDFTDFVANLWYRIKVLEDKAGIEELK